MHTSFILAAFWFGNVKQLHLGKRRPCSQQGSGGSLKADIVGDHVLACSSRAFVEEPGCHIKEMRNKDQEYIVSGKMTVTQQRLNSNCTEGGEALWCLTDWK